MNKNKIIVSWLLVFIWMGIIFYFSNMNTLESNNKSKKIIDKVVTTTIDTTNNTNITTKEKQNLINMLNKPLRKCAHACVYLILSLLILHSLLLSFKNLNNKHKLAIIITIIICFIYSLSDEYHQTFIYGRTGQFSDCIIDTIGSSIGAFIFNIYKKKKKERNKK